MILPGRSLDKTHTAPPAPDTAGGDWIIIALVILLLFGGKKIPELMRGLGKGVKSFKDGVNEAKDEINKAKDELDKPVDPSKN